MKIGNKHFYFWGRHKYTSPKSLEDLAVIAKAKTDHYIYGKAKEFVRLLQSGEHLRYHPKHGHVFQTVFFIEECHIGALADVVGNIIGRSVSLLYRSDRSDGVHTIAIELDSLPK